MATAVPCAGIGTETQCVAELPPVVAAAVYAEFNFVLTPLVDLIFENPIHFPREKDYYWRGLSKARQVNAMPD
eukprot:1315154-Amorphochlora_amoeboformis.AAC.1